MKWLKVALLFTRTLSASVAVSMTQSRGQDTIRQAALQPLRLSFPDQCLIGEPVIGSVGISNLTDQPIKQRCFCKLFCWAYPLRFSTR